MSKQNSVESDVAFIAALADVLEKHGLTEVDVERVYGDDDRMTVRVARQINMVAAAAPVAAPAPAAIAPAPVAAAPAAAPAAPTDSAPDPAQDPNAVTSPMVGTAYLAAEPGAPNFVSVGDKVEEGATILIIEAMKTMNHIPAPRSGTVRRILIDDGAPVEYGAPLVILD